MIGFKLDKVRAVFFDLDDTLYRQSDYEFFLYDLIASEVEKKFGVLAKSYSALLRSLYPKRRSFNIFSEALKPVCGKVDVSSKIWDQFVIKKILPIYRYQYPDHLELYCWVEKVFQYLQKSHIKIGIITNGQVQMQQKKMELLDLAKYNLITYISDEFGRWARKPSIYMFNKALFDSKLHPDEMVFVGDDVECDRACEQAGIQFVDVEEWKLKLKI